MFQSYSVTRIQLVVVVKQSDLALKMSVNPYFCLRKSTDFNGKIISCNADSILIRSSIINVRCSDTCESNKRRRYSKITILGCILCIRLVIQFTHGLRHTPFNTERLSIRPCNYSIETYLIQLDTYNTTEQGMTLYCNTYLPCQNIKFFHW